ncbi:hypothetical protein ACFO26_00685 [Lactococcus nasutitermitis]|uniref:Uncharacterized protein n=1 Tax=Lactococcus nasutitermitis TaxID=1652957 RepID=A0ABV9JD75_9LACT|nr:hypothetical protein [Lactococcus nasutitermitis]
MTRKLTEGKLYHADFDRFSTWTALAALLVPADFELAEVQDEIFQNGAAVIRLRYTRNGENIELNGKKITVAGTKYKCFMPSSGAYAWVIFGKEKNAIIFEREIEWSNGRTTEKWLHDTYLDTGKLDFIPVRRR